VAVHIDGGHFACTPGKRKRKGSRQERIKGGRWREDKGQGKTE
jgi:hypothetical protein